MVVLVVIRSAESDRYGYRDRYQGITPHSIPVPIVVKTIAVIEYKTQVGYIFTREIVLSPDYYWRWREGGGGASSKVIT